MENRYEIYRCTGCGSIIEIMQRGKGTLSCCSTPMQLLKENTVDASMEKHVPVVEKDGGKLHIKVGSIPHPMEEKHYIEWIEVITTHDVYRKYLDPGSAAQAEFIVEGDILAVRELCNLHGLWKTNT